MNTSSLLLAALVALPWSVPAASNQLLSWNNLGMHCMDSDYSVFSILPPYNTIHAQLLVQGRLLTNGTGYTVRYEAVADPDGSVNSTAMGKGNFYEYAAPLYGAVLGPEMGLAGWAMPGISNRPQAMLFEPTNQPAAGVFTPVNWFRAEGIPIAPFDDEGRKNTYPMMRLIARNGAGTPIATNDIVLPVSDEMDCRVCHGSGAVGEAEPGAGWVWAENPDRDYRLNIVRLHDERQFLLHPELYHAALAARGFNPEGLYRGVVADHKPVLCAVCHASEALGTGSYSNIPPLTASVHAGHAGVTDPELHITLDNSSHRAACYRCHPGSTTRCLRGAMGGAIARDGSLEMQCQSCHGTMSEVGSIHRVGWFMEPNCQSCHTGTATDNNGQIRYTSVFTDNGEVRIPVNASFATQPDTPAAGISLYRFSAGHGGLQCSACHGSTHAEFPATHRNDNLRNERIQGHAGVTAECTACHVSMPSNSSTVTGGPHGMHPIGQGWVIFHHDAIHSDTDHFKCAVCHGSNFRGTVLSRAMGPRHLTASLDGGTATLDLFQGAMIGCYNCHNGPRGESLNASPPPVAEDISTQTTCAQPVVLDLPISGNGAAARILSQVAHGSVGLTNARAVYYPEPGFVGTDTFTFAAWDGAKNSALATATIEVGQGPFSIAADAMVPPFYPAGWPVPFGVRPWVSNINAVVAFEWDFGDGSPMDTTQRAPPVFDTPGTYAWRVRCSVRSDGQTASVERSGSLEVREPEMLEITTRPGGARLAWPAYPGDALLEWTEQLEPFADWTVATNQVRYAVPQVVVEDSPQGVSRFYRLRKL